MFLGLPEAAESEGFDRDTLDMPAKQIALLEQVAAANQNVVVVLSNGSVVSVSPGACVPLKVQNGLYPAFRILWINVHLLKIQICKYICCRK